MADFKIMLRLAGLTALFGLGLTGNAMSGVMSREMLENRTLAAVKALAETDGYANCRIRPSAMVSGLHFIECPSANGPAVWAGWTHDGETSSLAAANAAAKAITPPAGSGVPPENDAGFLRVAVPPAKMQTAIKMLK